MSISFDRIAERYDATRGFPPGVEAQIGASFRRLSGMPTSARLLEIGVGTGRIAIPLASAGYHYTGADISSAMMQRLRQQLPAHVMVDLLRADATALPLRDACMDGAISVHVLHLIAGWERAVAELRRVLRQGGTLALGFNITANQSDSEAIREHWRMIVAELGGDTRRPGVRNEEADALLQQIFGPPRREILASWEQHETIRERLDQLATRTTSDTWQLPDAILHESLRRVEQWARDTYGDLEQPRLLQANFTMLFYTNS
jgi:ubiquinone/menaquinone biosynthesis C-methylase UbiE